MTLYTNFITDFIVVFTKEMDGSLPAWIRLPNFVITVCLLSEGSCLHADDNTWCGIFFS